MKPTGSDDTWRDVGKLAFIIFGSAFALIALLWIFVLFALAIGIGGLVRGFIR